MGAVLMSYEVAGCLNVENFFTERDASGEMCLRRGFALHPGQNVLVVEDVVTTGGSVREVIQLVRDAKCTVLGVGAIVDRTGGKIDFSVPFKSVISIDVESYEAENCPLCKEGEISLYKPGSKAIGK